MPAERIEVHALLTNNTFSSWQRMTSRLVLHGPVCPQIPSSMLQLNEDAGVRQRGDRGRPSNAGRRSATKAAALPWRPARAAAATEDHNTLNLEGTYIHEHASR